MTVMQYVPEIKGSTELMQRSKFGLLRLDYENTFRSIWSTALTRRS